MAIVKSKEFYRGLAQRRYRHHNKHATLTARQHALQRHQRKLIDLLRVRPNTNKQTKILCFVTQVTQGQVTIK